MSCEMTWMHITMSNVALIIKSIEKHILIPSLPPHRDSIFRWDNIIVCVKHAFDSHNATD